MSKADADAAAALRHVSPRDFVRARNALAAELAKAGKDSAARQISRLRRPSPVVWVLNQTAVARSHEYRALSHAVDQLRRAQLGQGELRAATGRYRDAFESVARNTARALRDAGSAVSPALERRLRSTLLAAVTDRRLRSDLAAGRLVDEHADPGFEVLSRGPVPAEFLHAHPQPARSSGPVRPKTASPARRRSEGGARRAAQQARRALRALDRLARQKERIALAAEKAVVAARQRLQELEQKGRALRVAADQAKENLEKADDRARAATTRTR